MTEHGETRTMTVRDGRSLAYVEHGRAGGPLVVHHHGGPSSRYEGALLGTAAERQGVRLVTVDRPGFGRSDPHPARTYRSWADDLLDLVDSLDVDRFGVSGWSEGGPWVLAAAAYVDPDRLGHVSHIAGGDYGAFGDDWAAPLLSSADRLGGSLALHHEVAFRFMYEVLSLDARHFRRSYLASVRKAVGEYDRRILDDPGVAEVFGLMSAECFAEGVDGLVRDSELLYRRWEFDVRSIERPVHVWQGTDDHLVPEAVNRRIADEMPGAVWHGVEGGGHLIGIGEADRILAIAAADLAS